MDSAIFDNCFLTIYLGVVLFVYLLPPKSVNIVLMKITALFALMYASTTMVMVVYRKLDVETIYYEFGECLSGMYYATRDTAALFYREVVVFVSLIVAFVIVFTNGAIILYRWYIDNKTTIVEEEEEPPTKVESAHFQPEKMMPHSVFENSVMPKFQCEIHGSRGGSPYHLRGQAFRVEAGLCTATHVIADLDHIKIVVGNRFKILDTEQDADQIIQIEGDLSLILLEDNDYGRLELSKAKLSPLAVDRKAGLIGQIVAGGKRSYGFLQPLEDRFGYIEYQGSTVGGFSGAPYYINNRVFGMHLGGCLSNIGYDAAYLRSMLNPARRTISPDGVAYVGEDSEEWLLEQAAKAEFEWSQSPFSPDEYRVKLRGQYYFVDEDVFSKMQNTNSHKSKRIVTNLDDLELEACEDPRSEDGGYSYEPHKRVAPLTNNPKINIQDLPLAPREALTFQDQGNLLRAPAVHAGALGQEMVLESAQPQSKPTLDRMGCDCRKNSVTSHTGSQMLTPAPLNVVLERTRPSKKSRPGQKLRLTRKIEQLQQRFRVTPDGE